MGKKGSSGHLKREAAPRFWPIQRKVFTWTVKPIPGPHPIRQGIPLIIIVREILGFAKTRREAEKMISQGKILVDGEVRRDERFPAGLMDVISIPDIEKDYRILPSKKGLFLHPISRDEAKFKICRIENKNVMKNGRIQLNLHDGRNILIKAENPQNPVEDIYQTLDTLKISLENQEILEHMKPGEGMMALFVSGKNMGKYGTIESIKEQSGQKRRRSLLTIMDEGKIYRTTLNYVFVIGDKNSRISLPGMEGQ